MTPLERYPLTFCGPSLVIPSLNEASLSGPLASSHPEQLRCGVSDGMSLNLDSIDPAAELPRFESTNSLSDLQNHFTNSRPSGLTIAAWITPDATEARVVMQPIVTFGSKMPVALEDRLLPGAGCPGYEFRLAQFRKNILVSYTDNDPARTCRYLLEQNVQLTDVLTHVTITFDSFYTNVYINGVPVIVGAPNNFDVTLQNWNLTNASLQLFSDYTSGVVFEGSIHQVDIFDQYLDETQVGAVYDEGVVRGVATEGPTGTQQPISGAASTNPSLQPSTSPSHKPSASPSREPSASPSADPTEVHVLAKGHDNDVIIRQDATDPLPIILGSLNTTSSVFQLEVEILSLPRHGFLMHDSFDVVSNSRFSIAKGTSEVSFRYKLKSADYFNAPAVNAYGRDLSLDSEFFEFRVNAYDSKSELVATSTTLTQSVTVLHVNHPPNLSAPEEAVLDIVDKSHATVTGVDFSDPLDFNLDRVRVDIWANEGELTLVPGNRFRADFDSCLHQEGLMPWQCDGIRDRNMTFFAIPDDVLLLLGKLAYNSLNPGSGDEITIRVSDGAGGTCLDETEHIEYGMLMGNTLTSVRDGCFQVEARIRVPGYDIDPFTQSDNKTSSGLFGLDFLEIPDLLFYGLLISLIVACACCLRRIPSCLARGSAVEVDDNSISKNVCEEAVLPEEEV